MLDKTKTGFASTTLIMLLMAMAFIQGLRHASNGPTTALKVEAPAWEAPPAAPENPEPEPEDIRINGVLKRGETLASILGRQGFSSKVVHAVSRSARNNFRFKYMRAGNPYSMLISADGALENIEYTIDDFSKILVYRDPEQPLGFGSERIPIVYDIQHSIIKGEIEHNLVLSLADTLEPSRLAIDMSEIFAWDIDFTADLRKGDSFELLIEERWQDNEFRKYGRIIAAHFRNNGEELQAYYFDGDKKNSGYYDEKGRPLRRGFLSSPLRYKYISSRFSRSRLHPILRIRRPHLGVDYAAPTGTPVQAASDGTVKFAGRKGGFGKLIILRHPTGHETYYGHLSRYGKGIRSGREVTQGQVIGFVGSTGLSTGPHLDYRVKKRDRFVDPLRLKSPRPEPLSGDLLTRFNERKSELDLLFRESRYSVLKDDLKEVRTTGPPERHSI